MELREIISKLCELPGPAGFEDAAVAGAKEMLAPYVDEIKTDVMGSLVAVKRCGKENAKSIMLEAHIDEIGLVIMGHENGYLRFNTLGGIDPRMLPAREIKILTEPPVYGVIDVMPPHALSQSEMDKSLPKDKLFIDIGMSQEEAEKAVPIGTPCVFAGGTMPLGDDQLCGKALDDRSCAAVIIKTMEELCGKELDVDIYCLLSVQEELGCRGAVTGAFGIAPDYAIAMDVTFANQPDVPKSKSCEMGKAAIAVGPHLNRMFTNKIISMAEEKEIPYQIEVCPGGTGTDASPIQISREGIATALISLPIKYMHSPVETMKLSDAGNMVKLLVQFIENAGEVL